MTNNGYDYEYSPYNIITFTCNDTKFHYYDIVGKYLRILNITTPIEFYLNSENGFSFLSPYSTGVDNFEFRRIIIRPTVASGETITIITSSTPIELPLFQFVKSLPIYYTGSEFYIALPGECYLKEIGPISKEIRNTSPNTIATIPIVQFQKIGLLINNGLNQDTTITIQSMDSNTTFSATLDTVNVTAGTTEYWTGNKPTYILHVYAQCSTAPTSGSLDVVFFLRT